MTRIYGIANCSTVKKARDWLAVHGDIVEFHDYKKHGVPADRLRHWVDQAGWEKLVNRQGTTWRKLSDAERDAVVDQASAITLMLAHPSVIRRPVVETGDTLLIGFDAARYAAAFGK